MLQAAIEKVPSLPDEVGVDGEVSSTRFARLQFWARLERGLRLISFLPMAMWLAYDNKFDITFTYMIPVMYVVFSALIPPTFAGGMMGIFGGVPHSAAGGIYSTLILYWCVHAPQDWPRWGVELVTVIFFGLTMLAISSWKVHNSAASLAVPMAAFTVCLAYHIQRLHRTVLDGIRLEAPLDVTSVPPVGSLQWAILQYLNALPNCPWTNIIIDPLFTISCTGTVPAQITAIEPSIYPLVGQPVYIYFGPGTQVAFHIPLEDWFLKLYYVGRGSLGLYVNAFLAGTMGAILALAASLLPPIRLTRNFVRDSLTHGFCQTKTSNIKTAQRLMLINAADLRETDLRWLKGATTENSDVTKSGPHKLTRPKTGVAVDDGTSVLERSKGLRSLTSLSALEYCVWSPWGLNNLSTTTQLIDCLEKSAVFSSMLEGRVTKKETVSTARLSLTSALSRVDSERRARGLEGYLRIPSQLNLNKRSREALREIVLVSLHLQQTVESSIALRPASTQASAQCRLIRHVYRALSAGLRRLNGLTAALLGHIHSSKMKRQGLGSENALFLANFLTTYVEVPAESAVKASMNLQKLQKRTFKGFLYSIFSILGPYLLSLWVLISPLSTLFRHCKKDMTPKHSLIEEETSAFLQCSFEHCSYSDQPASVTATQWIESRRGKRRIMEHFKFWIRIRFMLGMAGIFAFVLMVDGWSNRHFTADPPINPYLTTNGQALLDAANVRMVADLVLKGPLGGWTVLGFFTCFCLTWQATLKRSLIRLSGIGLGCLNGWLCLKACGYTAWAQCLWLCVTLFIAAFIYADSRSPRVAANARWGYAGQVFTYTSTILVTETHLRQSTMNEIVVQRILGHCVGIGCSAICALLIFPVSIRRALRKMAADRFPCITDTLAAVCEIGLAPLTTLFEASSPQAERKEAVFSSTYASWTNFAQQRLAVWQETEDSASLFETDNCTLRPFLSVLQTPQYLTRINFCLRRLRIARQHCLERLAAIAELERRYVGEPQHLSVEQTELAISEHSLSVYQDLGTSIDYSLPDGVIDRQFSETTVHAAVHSASDTLSIPLRTDFAPLSFDRGRSPAGTTISNVSSGHSRFLDSLATRSVSPSHHSSNLTSPSRRLPFPIPIIHNFSPDHKQGSSTSRTPEAREPQPLQDSKALITSTSDVSDSISGSRAPSTVVHFNPTIHTRIISHSEATSETTSTHQERRELGIQTSSPLITERSTSVTGLIASCEFLVTSEGASRAAANPQPTPATVSFVQDKDSDIADTDRDLERHLSSTLSRTSELGGLSGCDVVANALAAFRGLKRVATLLEFSLSSRQGQQQWSDATHTRMTAQEFCRHCICILDWCEGRLITGGQSVIDALAAVNESPSFTPTPFPSKRVKLATPFTESTTASQQSGNGRPPSEFLTYQRALCVFQVLQTEAQIYREVTQIVGTSSKDF